MPVKDINSSSEYYRSPTSKPELGSCRILSTSCQWCVVLCDQSMFMVTLQTRELLQRNGEAQKRLRGTEQELEEMERRAKDTTAQLVQASQTLRCGSIMGLLLLLLLLRNLTTDSNSCLMCKYTQN